MIPVFYRPEQSSDAATPLVEARLKELGVTVVGPERRSPEYLKRFLDAEIEKWAVTIKASGVSLD